PNVIRASQGSVFAVAPIVADVAEALSFLRSNGARLVATTPASTTPHWAADLRGTLALLVGTEATGLSDAWLKSADELVRIPMLGSSADSLNASVAGAVVLYEALRQRSS
ncbi:MAG TPA: TrmH family RNA methyltransferase, partial [Trueperaceae bacterium]|nr:TrmH family RNA methyltransferase [Trueperaceae bacterium]